MQRKLTLAVSVLLSFATAARADITIGFVTSLSGPGSSIGLGYAKGIAAAYEYKAQMAGEKVRLIQLDDGSDPSAATRNARKLVEEEKVDVLIGTATVPSTVAMIAVASELKVPMICVSPIPPKPASAESQWAVTVPQSADLLVKIVADRMKRDGVKKLGYIGFSDGWGDLVYAGAKAAEARGDMQVVTNERYARTDTSVTGQILRLMAAKPDAVLIGGSATQGALPLLSLSERGFKGGLYGTGALVNPEFVRVGGKAAEAIKLSVGPVVVAEQLPDDHFSKMLSMEFRAAYERANKAPVTDQFSGLSFDAWRILDNAVERAIKTAKPGDLAFRAALRDAILSTHELTGVHAVYNFKPGENYGVDERSLVIVQLTNGAWKYVP
ncbi:ABC transporter substrate-binding protein [Bradyrhizobium sp. TM239]|uniref:ABC transporter substrate-binding protein n=1 Tax=Bradyrhizobium sp. TM239 TaxID=2599802 RepID=UPI0027D59ADF|nr:ABC transporter substrate-binding protein [Bradyrhizobium sp. TM239]